MSFQHMSGKIIALSGSEVAIEENVIEIEGKEVEVAYTVQFFDEFDQPHVFWAGETNQNVILGLSPIVGYESKVAFLEKNPGDKSGFQTEEFHGCRCTLRDTSLKEGKQVTLIAHRKAGDKEFSFLVMWRPNFTDYLAFGWEANTRMPMVLQQTTTGVQVFFPKWEKSYKK